MILWKTFGAIVAAGGVLGLGGTIAGRVKPAVAEPGTLSLAQRNRVEAAAGATLLGQFRTSMADFLWLKVDKYLHNGVDLRGMTAHERGHAHPGHAAHAPGEHDCGHHEDTTVVPAKMRDWRGVFGDLDRAVKPYEDMQNHKHHDPKEALPLFRLMTWSNPRFVPGYVVGASMIARDVSKVPEAIAFLQQGETNNPHSIEIQSALGMLVTVHQHRWDQATPYLKRAIALGTSRDPQTLTEDETEAYQNAFRWLVLNRREAGRPVEARQAARAGLQVFPNDTVCRRYLQGYRGL